MEQETKPSKPSGFTWPTAFTIIALVTIVAGIYLVKSFLDVPRDVTESGREALRDIQEIARAFSEGTVTTTFISYAAEVSGSNYLQFATLKQMELFERSESGTALWGQLQLPEVVVQARAPVEYTYYLDLNGTWEMRLEDRTVLVTAPPIEFNTPAIDPSAIQYDVREGSIFRDEEVVLDKLRAGLMEMSRRRAKDNISLIRELGRRKTAEFVDNWLKHAYQDGASYHVEVRFADEVTVPPVVKEVEPVR
jgi:hypothetical protein